MSTGTELVQRALQQIGVHSPLKSANAAAIEEGRLTLNSLNEELLDDDIILGTRPLEAVGQQFGEPAGTTNPLVYILAIRLAPSFPNATLSQELRVNASKGMGFLERKFKQHTINKKSVSGTLPRGQGNRSYWGDRYFDEGESLED